MPALPPVPKVLRIALKQTLSEDLDVVNILYFSYTAAPPTNTQLDALAGSIYTYWVNNWSAVTLPLAALTNVHVIDLSSPTSGVGDFSGNGPGLNPGTSLGGATSLVMSYKIARRYRGGRPRSYLAGIPASGLTDEQLWSSTFLGTAVQAWTNFLNRITTAITTDLGGTGQQVNVSYYQGFTPFTYPSGRTRDLPKLRAGGPVVDIVTSVVPNRRPGSQRRRNLQGV